MMVHATKIVGYTFMADISCPSCARLFALEGIAGNSGGPAVLPANLGSTEKVLDEWAGLIGVNRADEFSYDEDDFPKVIFASQIEDDEQCADCGKPLIG